MNKLSHAVSSDPSSMGEPEVFESVVFDMVINLQFGLCSNAGLRLLTDSTTDMHSLLSERRGAKWNSL